MSNETEELKTKIRTFLDKQGLESESQYFLLLGITEDIKDEIMIDDDDDDDEPEEEEDLLDLEEVEDEVDDEPEEVAPKKPKLIMTKEVLGKSDHNLKVKKLLATKKEKEDIGELE